MEILSKELIKPSSPTPHHLSNHKLSFLDQFAPSVYIPLIFFYPLAAEIINPSDNLTQKSQLLKQSLSNTLTQYYPLAGRINGAFSVDCNDSGIEFVETQVHTQLAEVIEDSSIEELKHYFPNESRCKEEGFLLAIQANFFACGGLAIGACISHKIADGSSLVIFMKSWAATCRGDVDQVTQPIFDFTAHFPPKDLSALDSSIQNFGTTEEKIVTRRFVFSKEKLKILKKAACCAADSQVKDPTRIEVVTAFIWKNFIKAGKNKSYAAVHAVNLRPRINPELPENTIGNIWWYTLALSTPEAREDSDCYHLVSELRDAIRKINDNYVKKLQEEGDKVLSLMKKKMESYYNKDVEFCTFSSWSRFPIYEVDYGWGKPVWVSTTLPYNNLVILMNTSCGEGIEAWINMAVDNISINLQRDLDLNIEEPFD